MFKRYNSQKGFGYIEIKNINYNNTTNFILSLKDKIQGFKRKNSQEGFGFGFMNNYDFFNPEHFPF